MRNAQTMTKRNKGEKLSIIIIILTSIINTKFISTGSRAKSFMQILYNTEIY